MRASRSGTVLSIATRTVPSSSKRPSSWSWAPLERTWVIETVTPSSVAVSAAQVRSSGAQLEEVGRLLNDGAIRVAIDSAFPLADVSEAHERAAGGHIQGKIVLNVE